MIFLYSQLAMIFVLFNIEYAKRSKPHRIIWGLLAMLNIYSWIRVHRNTNIITSLLAMLNIYSWIHDGVLKSKYACLLAMLNIYSWIQYTDNYYNYKRFASYVKYL